MTDAAASESGSVFRLIYRSHSLIASDQRRSELGAIFNSARRNNKRLGVTGALVISEQSFVQALEGDESVVRDLYASITQDARHDNVSLLEAEVVEGRTFGRWAMAQVGTDGGSDIRLMSHAQKGVIVSTPGADRSVTPSRRACSLPCAVRSPRRRSTSEEASARAARAVETSPSSAG